MGHKGPVKVRPRCIGVEKALNPISIYLSIYCPLLAETGFTLQLLAEICNRKGQAIPVQEWTGPKGSRTFLVKEQNYRVTDPVITSNMGTESAVVMPKPSDCGRFMT
jgi:hypothetical protein